MAKAKTRAKATAKAKTAEKAPGKVVCFFFYGSIDDLGVELAKFADESQLAAELAETLVNLTTPKT